MTRESSLGKKRFLFTLEDIISENDIPNCFVEDMSDSPIIQAFLDMEVPEETNIEMLNPSLTLNIVRVFNYAIFCANYLKRYFEFESAEILKNQENKKLISAAYLAIIFYFWNYNHNDKKQTISDAVERFNSYITNKLYLENDSRYEFVQIWIDKFLNLEDVILFIKAIDTSEDIPEVSEIHKKIINGLRDAFDYSPIYLPNLVETDNYTDIAFNLFLSISDIYKVANFESAIEIINAYCFNISQPRTDFTRELINLRNSENLNPSTITDRVYDILKGIYTTANVEPRTSEVYKTCNKTFEKDYLDPTLINIIF